MSKLGLAFSVLGLFGALAACAYFDFPQAFYDGEVTRSTRAVDWMVHTVATDNFGHVGGAVLFGVIGLVITGLIVIGSTGAAQPVQAQPAAPRPSKARSSRLADEPTTPSPAAAPKTARRRTIGPASIAANEAAQAQESDADSADETASQKDPYANDVWNKEEVDAIVDGDNLIPPLSADTSASPVPAWGLMLASPWKDVSRCRSWLGGLPCAPAGFEWPRDSGDDEPMHFYAQIDLSELGPEPETGARAPGLPEKGALLVFIGTDAAVRIVDAADLNDAEPIAPPEDLPKLEKFGYWIDEKIFPAWPIKPQAFLEKPIDEDVYWEELDGEYVPDAFPVPHKEPADWITTWGMAALEAEMVATALTHAISNANWKLDYNIEKLTKEEEQRLKELEEKPDEPEMEDGDEDVVEDNRTPEEKALEAAGTYGARVLSQGPELLRELEEWKARAETEDPSAPVDEGLLAEIFAKRHAFTKDDGMYGATQELNGSAFKVWEKIWFAHRSAAPFATMRDIPEAYRRFAQERITAWRRHRLFGIEPPFSNNFDDLTGRVCLISIGADPLLETQTEHEYGISLWCPVEDIEAGRFDDLQIVRHCAV